MSSSRSSSPASSEASDAQSSNGSVAGSVSSSASRSSSVGSPSVEAEKDSSSRLRGVGNSARDSAAPTFESLGVEPFLAKALRTLSIRAPTPVQRACIPHILRKDGVIGVAQTGSGKTLAFGLPLIQQLSEDAQGGYGLILTPTRELAFQIAEQLRAVGAPISISCEVIVGGVDMQVQTLALARQPHVIVATPGRLTDLLRSNAEFSLSRVRYFVLDEADRLLTQTFAADLGYIVDRLPAESARQTLLFTATLTPALAKLREKPRTFFFEDAAAATVTPSQLQQRYVFIPSQVRELYLVYLLLHASELLERGEDEPQTILFVPKCHTAALFVALLNNLPDAPVACTALHSHMSQAERLRSLQDFRAARARVLVCTDVGSRGLDIPAVELVVNWNVPRNPDDYVHRVGRTARAGKSGTAVTIVTENDVDLVAALESRIATKLTELEINEDKALEILSAVTVAKRMAGMALSVEKFGEKEERNKRKHGKVTKNKSRKTRTMV